MNDQNVETTSGGTAVADPPKTKTPRKPRTPKAKVAKGTAKTAKKRPSKGTGNVVDTLYRKQYGIRKDVKAPSGGYRIDCGDDVAAALLKFDDGGLEKLANRFGLADKWSGWSGLNPGMRRMNLGNVIRGMVRRGELVLSKDGSFSKGEAPAKTKKVAKKK